MRVLLTNDDGPLDDKACPYLKYLVDEIRRSTDWELAIVVPHQQRLWIGKAHFANSTLLTSWIYTRESTQSREAFNNAFEGPFDVQQAQYARSEWQEWCLLDSTPAACADIGIHYLAPEAFGGEPVDLVLSGPNFGRNSSELYILTSGTVGAAMEAVTHGTKAIALSYAFFNLDHDFDILREAARISVALVAKLYHQLVRRDPPTDIYTVNIPLVPSLKLGQTRIHYAPILHNTWTSIYQPVSSVNERGQRQFQWMPDFKQVDKHATSSQQHSDLRVLLDEGISVTPLHARFHASPPFLGEIDISGWEGGKQRVTEAPSASALATDFAKFSVSDQNDHQYIGLLSIPPELYTFELWKAALSSAGLRVTTDQGVLDQVRAGNPLIHVFHYCEYEEIDFDLMGASPTRYVAPSYVYRKGITRKHYLAHTVRQYVAKNPLLVLARAFPELFYLELDYAEFLDDALDEACELRHEIERGDRTWILKPSMSDKGQGIRLFTLVSELQAIFDSFENESEEEEEEEEEAEESNDIITSQLRHFVVQEYKCDPLLLQQYGNRKFHLRVYVVCAGNLTVYVYREILALFALETYVKPLGNEAAPIPMAGHLTNTCVQGKDPLVVPFWEMEGLDVGEKEGIYHQVCQVTGDLFRAATSVDKVNFQPVENAVEVYGVDMLVTDGLHVTLLEVNGYPDFKQSGEPLKRVVQGLLSATAKEAIAPILVQPRDPQRAVGDTESGAMLVVYP